MDASDLLLRCVAGFAVVSTLGSTGFLLWHRYRPRKPVRLDHAPPVTILKPLKGLDEDLEANLRSFFELDYPCFQLLFGVADPDDPAASVVRRLLREYPEADAELVVGTAQFGLNPKVENLAAMLPRRRHATILISDSNVRAHPSYLRETACELADPGVGLVTNMFAGVGERKLGAALENLQLNGFIASNIATAHALGVTCVVGKSMLMPIKVLEAIGGLASVRNLLAEDQAIGVRVRKAGYRIALSRHVIANVNESRDLKWFLNRHSRWLKIRRQMARSTFLLEPLANLTFVGLLWALTGGDQGFGWGGLLVLCGLGIARDAGQTRLLRGTWPKMRDLPLSLVKDLFMLPIWLDALFSRKLQWRGHQLIVGRFTRVRAARISRTARNRVRRARRNRSRHAAD